MIRTRRGFLLPAAALIGAVVLSLAGVYFLSSRNQNARGRRFQGTLNTRYLSQGAVSLVRHVVRDYSHPTRKPQAKVDPTATFLDLAMAPPSILEESLEKARKAGGSSPQGDDRGLLDRLFGKGVSASLDALEATIVGAEVRVHIQVEAGPFPDAPPGYVDVIPKSLVVKIRAEAEWAGATRSHEGEELVVVYPIASPLLGRFPGNSGFTWHTSDTELSAKLFDGSRPDKPLMENQQALEAEGIQKVYQERGWVYPRHQQVAPGGGLDGLHYLLWKPESGKIPVPRSLLFTQTPATFQDEIPVPEDPLRRFQQPLIEGLVQGGTGQFSPYISNLAYPFSSLPWAPDYYQEDPVTFPQPVFHEGSPGPFGSTLDPSPTYAPGSRARLFAVSALTVDRDKGPEDETLQTSFVGYPLPFREVFGYLLPQIPRDAEGYDPTLGPRLPHTADGISRLPNRNLEVDSNFDGVPEFTVTPEVPYSSIPLWTNSYSMEALFPLYEDFRKVGSRIVDLPLNYLLELSKLSVEEAQEKLHEIVWGEGGLEKLKPWEELPYGLFHRDPVHALGKEESEQLHYGKLPAKAKQEGAEPGFLRELGGMEAFAAFRWMPTVYVYGMEGLEKFLPRGDLRGLRVHVMPETKEGPAYLKMGHSFQSGVLGAALVEVAADIPKQGAGDLVEVFADEIVVGAVSEPHLNIFAPSSGFYPVSKAADQPARLRGGAFLDTGASKIRLISGPARAQADKLREVLARYQSSRLCTAWDEDRDPLGEKAHLGYRIAWSGLR